MKECCAIARRHEVLAGLLPAGAVAMPPGRGGGWRLTVLGAWLVRAGCLIDYGYSVQGIECCLVFPREDA